jgi:hypothetical protein
MDVRSTIIRPSALMTCCTPIMPSPYNSMRWMRYFMGEAFFSHKHWIAHHGAKFPVLVPLHINFSH